MKTWFSLRLLIFTFFILMLVSCESAIIPESEIPQPDEDSINTTIMVYISGGAGDYSLSKYAMQDIEEIKAGTYGNPVRVIALVDIPPGTQPAGSWWGTRLYEIFHGELIRKADATLGLTVDGNEDIDIGNAKTLQNFVKYTLNTYESDYFGLVLWGHGSGIWRSGQVTRPRSAALPVRTGALSAEVRTKTLQTEGINQFLDDIIPAAGKDITTTLTTAEIGRSLKDREPDLLFVAFDTCLGAQYEVAYELHIQKAAQYLVASEDLVPATGWDYEAVLKGIGSLAVTNEDATSRTVPKPTDVMNELSKGYVAGKENGSLVADISIIGLTKFDALHTAFIAYMKRLDTLLDASPDDGTETDKARKASSEARKSLLLNELGTGDGNGNIVYSKTIQSFYNIYIDGENPPQLRNIDLRSFVDVVKKLKGFEEVNFQTLSDTLINELGKTVFAAWQDSASGRYLENVGGLSLALNTYSHKEDSLSLQPAAAAKKDDGETTYFYSTVFARVHPPTMSDPHLLAFVADKNPERYSYWSYDATDVTWDDATQKMLLGPTSESSGVLYRLFLEN